MYYCKISMLADKAIMVSEVACWLVSQLLVSPV